MEPKPDAVLTITELTQRIRRTLQGAFSYLWVEGEISNFSRSGAGHCYMTLKDDQSQLRAVIWRDAAQRLPYQLHDGLQILAAGNLDVYGGRGQYQLRIQKLQPKGIGPLELAFRQLRQRLEAEGLFRPDIKRPIPAFPRRLALITTPSGAAVRDFLEVSLRRWQGCDIVLAPTPVQGDKAAPAIAAALQTIAATGADVVALVRGGGSLEDLWAFNEEIVARAIRNCPLPVVTGVGHEVDVTIADLAADLRALTPTEAAERIFPDGRQIEQLLAQWTQRLSAHVAARVAQRKQQLDAIESSRPFRKPLELIDEVARRLDDHERSLCRTTIQRLQNQSRELTGWAKTLDALSPLQVLERGYALAVDGENRLVREAKRLQPGQPIAIRFHDGKAQCRVESTELHGET